MHRRFARTDGIPSGRRPSCRPLIFVVWLAASWSAACATSGSGRQRLEVEVGSQSIQVHGSDSNSRKREGSARKASVSQMGELRDEEASNIIRRESSGEDRGVSASSKLELPGAEMMFRENAASQDGAQPFFVGSWNGHRNNWYGDVGIAFIPQKDFKIVALGRHYHNVTHLTQRVPVTLWSVETKTPLAIVNVGPNSFHEGHYVFEPVEAPGVVVSQGREYRLTQACTPGMRDTWFDETITYTEVQSNAATGFARFKGAVNQSGYGYPVNEDGQFRRAGMVNFKMARPPVKIVETENGAIHSAGICRVMLVLCISPLIFGLTLA